MKINYFKYIELQDETPKGTEIKLSNQKDKITLEIGKQKLNFKIKEFPKFLECLKQFDASLKENTIL